MPLLLLFISIFFPSVSNFPLSSLPHHRPRIFRKLPLIFYIGSQLDCPGGCLKNHCPSLSSSSGKCILEMSRMHSLGLLSPDRPLIPTCWKSLSQSRAGHAVGLMAVESLSWRKASWACSSEWTEEFTELFSTSCSSCVDFFGGEFEVSGSVKPCSQWTQSSSTCFKDFFLNFNWSFWILRL